jgi:hypothetical protein
MANEPRTIKKIIDELIATATSFGIAVKPETNMPNIEDSAEYLDARVADLVDELLWRIKARRRQPIAKRDTRFLLWRPINDESGYDDFPDDTERFDIKHDTPWEAVWAFAEERLRTDKDRRGGFEIDDADSVYNYGFPVDRYKTTDELRRELETAFKRARVVGLLDDFFDDLRSKLLTVLGLDLSDRVIFWSGGE